MAENRGRRMAVITATSAMTHQMREAVPPSDSLASVPGRSCHSLAPWKARARTPMPTPATWAPAAKCRTPDTSHKADAK